LFGNYDNAWVNEVLVRAWGLPAASAGTRLWLASENLNLTRRRAFLGKKVVGEKRASYTLGLFCRSAVFVFEISTNHWL
jgi:hypothetical protein